uniref:Purple acid phosphatase N-terminal domain-containing protein n=1 Tax=Oncorhynchus kisutch TaxID=8019 RepID=A0A8C7DL10_ONCKI
MFNSQILSTGRSKAQTCELLNNSSLLSEFLPAYVSGSVSIQGGNSTQVGRVSSLISRPPRWITLGLFSPGLPASMEMTWTTINETEESTMEYGLWRGTIFLWTGSEVREIHIHRVTLTALRPASAYVYHCGSEAGWSDVFSFTALNESISWSPRFSIYGDMGNENPHIYDLILSGYAANSRLIGNGRIGDEFMRQIQSIAVYVPYMTCPGNHEARKRRSLTLIISLRYLRHLDCTLHTYEIYFFLDYGVDLIFKQYEWLKDLEEANMLGNRGDHFYSTSQKFGHTYSFQGFVYFYYFLHCRIIVKTSKLLNKSAISVCAISNPRDCSAFCSTDYGYTCMQQVSDDQYGKVIDSIWMVKEKHSFSAWF